VYLVLGSAIVECMHVVMFLGFLHKHWDVYSSGNQVMVISKHINDTGNYGCFQPFLARNHNTECA
jgi:hypothetical protein